MEKTLILRDAKPGICPGCGQPYDGHPKVYLSPVGLDRVYESHGAIIRERYIFPEEPKCPHCRKDGEHLTFHNASLLKTPNTGNPKVIIFMRCDSDYEGCGKAFDFETTLTLKEVHVDDPEERKSVYDAVLKKLRETVSKAHKNKEYRSLSPNEDKKSIHFVTAEGCGIASVPEVNLGIIPTIISDARITGENAELWYEDREFCVSGKLSDLGTEDLETILNNLK